jgi:hypothetical protein
MRSLVATACIVVIACGTLYLFTQWAAYSDAKERAAGRERAREELFRVAEAESGDEAKVKVFCKMIVSSAPDMNDSIATVWARNCTALGYSH